MSKSKLTDELITRIARELETGAYRQTVCGILGINYGSFRQWMNKGNKGESEQCVKLHQAVIAAEAVAEQRHLKVVEQAASEYHERVTKRVLGDTGQVIKTEESESSKRGDWRAASWWLERRHGQRWGQQKVDLLEAIKTFVSCGLLPEDCLQLGKDEFFEFMNSYRNLVNEQFESYKNTPDI